MDGVKVEYGNKVKLGAYYGRPTDEDWVFDYNKFWGANAAAKMGGFGLTAGYDKFTNSNLIADDNGVWNVGAKYDFGKASLGAIYMKSNLDVADDTTNKAIIVTGTVMGAEAAKPGSWGLWAKYYNQGYGTVIAHTMDGIYSDYGFQGWGAGVDYTIAKNMIGTFEYYDLDFKGMDAGAKTLWTQLAVTF
jgi:predicted porin